MRIAVTLLALGLGACFTPELDVAPSPTSEEACRGCAESACADTYAACVGDPACDEILTCAFACSPDDQGCVVGCGNASPDGTEGALALLDCVEGACAEDCASLSP